MLQIGKYWTYLCLGNFIKITAKILLNGNNMNIVQIRAHISFEENDLIAKGITTLLDKLTDITTSIKSSSKL